MLGEYLASAPKDVEKLKAAVAAGDASATALFRQAGVAEAEVEKLRGRLAGFEQRGLLRVEGPRWRLSDPEGLALSNAVLRELLLWWEEQRERGH